MKEGHSDFQQIMLSGGLTEVCQIAEVELEESERRLFEGFCQNP